MASISLSCEGWYGNSNRYVDLTLSSDYGSNTASFSIRSRSTTQSAGYPYTEIWVYVNGTQVHDSLYGKDWSSYPMAADKTFYGSCSIPTSGSILVELKVGVGQQSPTTSSSGYLTKVGTPSISTPSISSVGRTSANASASMTDAAGGSQSDFYIDCATSNFSGVVSTINGTSGTFTGLSSNTTYYVRANGSNGTNRGYSSVTSFKTTHNSPTIGTPSISQSRSGNTYTATFTYSVTYDNASYLSRKIEYGTTASYGSVVNNSKQITGLSPHQTYYYRITEVDNASGSSTKTGSFNTDWNAPTISSAPASNITDNSATITVNATADSNTSISKYQLLNSSQALLQESVTNSFSWTGLSDDTTYIYYVKVIDSGGKTTTSSALSFKTIAGDFTYIITSSGTKTKVKFKVINSSGTITRVKKGHVHIIGS